MMDANYTDGMVECSSFYDFQRGLRISLFVVMRDGNIDYRATLSMLKWQALVLWHEAGKPLPFVAHLGSFVRIEAANTEERAAS